MITMYQCRFSNCHKCTTLVGDVDGGETNVCGDRGHMQNLCTFCCEARNVLKIKTIEKGEKRRGKGGGESHRSRKEGEMPSQDNRRAGEERSVNFCWRPYILNSLCLLVSLWSDSLTIPWAPGSRYPCSRQLHSPILCLRVFPANRPEHTVSGPCPLLGPSRDPQPSNDARVSGLLS